MFQSQIAAVFRGTQSVRTSVVFFHIHKLLKLKCGQYPPKMCRGTYVAVNKLITKWYNNNIKTDDDINASIIAECIMILDNTMTCNTMNQCDANDIVMYLTTM